MKITTIEGYLLDRMTLTDYFHHKINQYDLGGSLKCYPVLN